MDLPAALIGAELSPDERDRLTELVEKIPQAVYARGQAYANTRRIHRIERTGSLFRADIEGQNLYSTLIDLESGVMRCTCPAENPCKHAAGLGRFLLYSAKQQTLFGSDIDLARSTELRLAIIFEQSEKIRYAAADEQGRRYPLAKHNAIRLIDRHKVLYAKLALAGDFEFNNLKVLFCGDISLEGVVFYFMPHDEPYEFAGFAEASYTFTENPDADELIYTDDSATHEPVNFLLNVEHPGVEAAPHRYIPYLLPNHAARTFQVSSTLRTHLNNRLWSLDAIMQNPELARRLPAKYQEAWVKRVMAGPRGLFSLYAARDARGRLSVRAELGVCYASDAEHFNLPQLNPELLYVLIEDVDDYRLIVFDFKRRDNPERTIQTVRHKSGVLITRNISAERKIVMSIYRKLRLSPGHYHIPKKQYARLFNEKIPALQNHGVLVCIHDSLAGIFTTTQAQIHIRQGSGIDWFEGQIEIEGLDKEDIRTLIRAYKAKEQMVQLKSGRWYSLNNIGLTDLLDALARLGMTPDSEGQIKKFSSAALVSLEQERAAHLRTTAGVKSVIQKFQRFVESKPVATEPPAQFQATLRPYQKEGLAFLLKLHAAGMGGILADDMGLGKTVQSIAAMACVAAENSSARFLIVCPLAAMGVWEHEIKRFAPHLSVYRAHGTGRNLHDAQAARIVLSSFATFALDADKFRDQHFAIAFIDEAQFAKNFKTRTAAALRKISADSILCLTGTPVENHVEDLWALMDIVFPGYLGTLQGFRSAYGKNPTAQNLETLKKKIRPFVLRRTKAEVLADLPAKNEHIVYVPMTSEQAKLYEQARRRAIQQMQHLPGGHGAIFEMLRHLTELRRISCHPHLEDPESDPLLSGKLQYLDEKLGELSETTSGVLLFSQFTDVLRVVEQLLKSRGIDPLYLDGSTSEKRRRELVSIFQSGANKFFLISLRAGGTALTLTQADTVIHLDPWWNPAVENQASDRAHRIGQTRRVFIYKLVSEKTVEEKVLLLQQKKRALFEALMSETGAMPAISREDIEFILSQ
jgi:superfamily II DNA or RNA helicase